MTWARDGQVVGKYFKVKSSHSLKGTMKSASINPVRYLYSVLITKQMIYT